MKVTRVIDFVGGSIEVLMQGYGDETGSFIIKVGVHEVAVSYDEADSVAEELLSAIQEADMPDRMKHPVLVS